MLTREETDRRLAAFSSLHPYLQSVMVLHRGQVVAEGYWNGVGPESYQTLNSITKSVLSALVGIALGEGKLRLSDSLADWFPDLIVPPCHAATVTVLQLLTMTAGFDRRLPRVVRAGSVDPLPSLLHRRGSTPAGSRFRYGDEDADLLAALVERAAGEPLQEYAQMRLFLPLGIWADSPTYLWKRRDKVKHVFSSWGRRDEAGGRPWKLDAAGRAHGGFGLHMTTAELAGFGQLYLQEGCWNQNQIIPVEYVRASTSPQTRGGFPEGTRYGYLWWIGRATDPPAYFASGYGGQYLYVLPERGLVVAAMSTPRRRNGQPLRQGLVNLAWSFDTAEISRT